jgi:hypothetical protein
MIYIYGDSHAHFCFKRLGLEYKDYNQPNITMHRIGRDNIIINYNKEEVQEKDIVVLVYGEVDCRCHIQRQIDSGRIEDDVIAELVDNYLLTIQDNVNKNIRVVIVGVIPQTLQHDYECRHGPIYHEFPFIGTDADRVRYTNKLNKLLEDKCSEIGTGYYYFNPYDYYTREEDGTLKYELSDNIVHLGDNTYFLEKFSELYERIISA